MKMNNIPSGASYELFSERVKTSKVSYAGGKFERIESKGSHNKRLRLLADGKIAIVNSTRPGGADKMIQDAAEMVKYGAEYNQPFAKAAPVKPLTLFDSAGLSSKQMIEMMDSFVTDLKKLDSRLTVHAGLTHKVREIGLQTSMGFDHSYQTSFWEVAANVTLVQGDDRFDIGGYRHSMSPNFDLKSIIAEIAQKLEDGKNVVDFKAGAFPVIFAPDQAPFILNPVVESLSGQAFFDKTSPWVDKLGTQTIDPRINLIDDGTLDNTYTSRPFDDEGTPTQRNILVENGVIQNIFLDNKYAARLGKTSTGNAGAFGPSTNYIDMTPGTKSIDDMVKSIDYGVIIHDTMGAWSGNPFAGIVSGTISVGFKIENGKIAGRIKDCMFTTNAFEHLNKHLIDLSSERKQVDAYLGGEIIANLPYMQLNEVVISTE